MPLSLSPRDIQDRVRLGASVADLAQEAGGDPAKIERYAYPVLMERSAMATRARQGYPVVGGVPTADTVEAVALATLTERGQIDLAATTGWDAYRSADGGWVLALTWTVGRSENLARWKFHPGGSGGTLVALDDAARSLVDPTPQPLRTVPEAVEEQPAAAPLHPLAIRTAPDDSAPAAHPALFGGAPTPTRSARSSGGRLAAALADHSGPGVGITPVDVPRTGTEDSRSGARGPMPSWEDVLLGGR